MQPNLRAYAGRRSSRGGISAHAHPLMPRMDTVPPRPHSPTHGGASTERSRCVLIGDQTGDNRLAVAVAAQLVRRGAAAVIVAGRDQGDARAIREAVIRNLGDDDPQRAEIQAKARRSPALVAVTPFAGVGRLERLFASESVALHSAHCLLALAQDAEQNLRVAVVARRVAAHVSVVLRSFDPEFAHELERERAERGRYVERAYSVAHLSAPSFVGAVLLGRARDHLVTMRVEKEYVSVWQVKVPGDEAEDPIPPPRRRRSAGLLGRSPEDVLRQEGCQVLARRDEHGMWKRAGVACPTTPLQAGETILLGGPQREVLDLARSRPRPRLRYARPPRRRRPATTTTNRGYSRRSGVKAWAHGGLRAIARWRERLASASLSTQLLVVLATLVTASVLISPAHRPGELLYQWASTALGNPRGNPDGAGEVVAAVGLLAGGIALGLATSIMSAALIQRRMIEGMRRRARRLRGHVIIVGLDDVGARVAALLNELGVRAAVVEPDTQRDFAALAADRRFQEVADHAPILTGELGEMLVHARVDRAAALIACTEDSLVNVQACMRAKRDNGVGLRMIARVFDDEDASHAARAFGIDSPIAAVEEAAPAFADAALEDGTRTIHVDCTGSPEGALELRSVVWHGERAVDAREIKAWHDRGIRILALVRGGALRALSAMPAPLRQGDRAVLAGPEDALALATRAP
jgi:Trk K+ transport system NAD-binding subunit